MITRMIYRAEFEEGQVSAGVKALERSEQAKQRIKQGELMTAAAYVWRNSLFLYYECIDSRLSPDEIAGAAVPYLKDWPGHAEPRKWIPMIDVFHFNEPADTEHWLRKERVEKRVGRVAHLKPEMISSYIYYHYQLQEERSFTGDKYEIIAMHENLLFGYQEFPKVIEEPVVPGRLKTKGTPENWQDSRMDLHFQPWEEDGYLYFKPIEPIFAYYIGDYK
ncbi:hypothetical protein [Paenibacillus anseongense]|uniref:hypothetical protein n=1 Tax=Paenibacillus anseongense TaxID=2682845 RepID=UPI002DBA20F4|nr:hypothetical protein [Paenibacillus anseongense]MEC0268289.1 hypothetical protein [Paenibacillus anseongense]